jgi:hypothetical protein
VDSDPGPPPPAQDEPPAQVEPAAAPPKGRRVQRAKVGVTGFFGWLGIFGVGAALGAILGWQDVRGWLIGVIVSAVTVALGFLLRRSLPSV